MSNAIEVTDYRECAEQHRPVDAQALAASIRELARIGLTVHDIAATLRLGIGAVQQALEGNV